jgi:hypothetical protein
MHKNPTYWREYRERNPEYVRRNRAMQKKRNATRKNAPKANDNGQHRIAKMNEWTTRNVISSGCFRVPVHLDGVAKIDAIIVRIEVISEPNMEVGDGKAVCKENTL